MGFHFLHLPPELAERFARERMTLPALRDFIERRIEADIALLDEMDGDADLEPSLCGIIASAPLDARDLEEDAGDEPECGDAGHDLDREGFTDDNGLGDPAGHWEQGFGFVGLGGFNFEARP